MKRLPYLNKGDNEMKWINVKIRARRVFDRTFNFKTFLLLVVSLNLLSFIDSVDLIKMLLVLLVAIQIKIHKI